MSAEPDYLPADALAEEEPKYLRRQKPVEIRKRKFSRKAWPLYRRVLVGRDCRDCLRIRALPGRAITFCFLRA